LLVFTWYYLYYIKDKSFQFYKILNISQIYRKKLPKVFCEIEKRTFIKCPKWTLAKKNASEKSKNPVLLDNGLVFENF
jgi:hypothetical protein